MINLLMVMKDGRPLRPAARCSDDADAHLSVVTP